MVGKLIVETKLKEKHQSSYVGGDLNVVSGKVLVDASHDTHEK